MIFLTATGWPVNWSRAELSGSRSGQLVGYLSCGGALGRAGLEFQTYQTSPKAPMPTGCKSVYLENEKVSNQDRAQGIQTLQTWGHCAPACDLKGRAEDLGPYEFRHDGRIRC
jgi:hypothetical protein